MILQQSGRHPILIEKIIISSITWNQTRIMSLASHKRSFSNDHSILILINTLKSESWDQNQRQYSVDLPNKIILLFHQQTAEQSYCKQKHSSSGCLAQCSIGHFKDLEGSNNYFQQELCSQYYMKEWDSKQIGENKIENHQPKVNLVTKNLHKSYPARK